MLGWTYSNYWIWDWLAADLVSPGLLFSQCSNKFRHVSGPRHCILNICPKHKSTRLWKQLELKSHNDPPMLIVGVLNTPHSPKDKSSRKKSKQRNNRANGHYKPNGPNISTEHFIQTQKNTTFLFFCFFLFLFFFWDRVSLQFGSPSCNYFL